MDLNEVATLIHVTSEIVQNHPKYSGIARYCGKRLDEINQECLDEERAPSDRAYPKVVTPPAGPENSAVQERAGGPLRQLSTDKRSDADKLLDQPVEELPEGGTIHENDQPTIVDRRV